MALVRYGLQDLINSAGNATGDFLANNLNEVREAVCDIYDQFPGWLTQSGLGFFGFYNNVCKDRPPKLPSSPPFTGGQCEFCYKLRWLLRVTDTGYDELDGDYPRETSFWGPIFSVGVDVDKSQEQWIFSEYVVAHGSCAFPRSDKAFKGIYAPGPLGFGRGNVELLNLTVEPFDGGEDYCGDPPGSFPIEPDAPEGNSTTVNVTFSFPGTTINVPVTVFAPTANFNLNFDAIAKVDLGGINFSIDFGGGTVGSDPPSDGLPPDVTENINNINNVVVDISNDITNIENDIEEIKNRECPDPCNIDPILQAISELRSFVDVQTDEIDAYLKWIGNVLKQTIYRIEIAEETPQTILQGTMTFDESVRYVSIPQNAALIYILIEGDIPPSVRAYKLDGNAEEIEIGIGNVSIYRQSTDIAKGSEYDLKILFSKRNFVPIPEHIRGAVQLRLSLKPGVQFRVIDSGLRWKQPELPEEPQLT